MTAREIIKKLKEDGWYAVTSPDGSHTSFKHPVKPGKVTVPQHKGKDMTMGTLKSIAHQAGIRLP